MGKFPPTKSIIKKNINIKSGIFDIADIYKKLKEKSEDLDYTFIEKEQGTKFGKYGQELKLNFYLDKEFDYFGKAEIFITLFFENVHKLKNGLDNGDCTIKIDGVQILDYNNRWGKNPFIRHLYKLYSTIKMADFKSKYTIPLITEVNELYDFIKELFGGYNQN